MLARVRSVGVFSLLLAVLLSFASANRADAANFAITGCTNASPSGRCWLYDPPVLPFLPIAQAPDATGIVNQTGTSPADLTLPPGVFNQPGAIPFKVGIIPQKGLPYLQFATAQFVQTAPTASAMFFDGPKTSRPASFSYCPGYGGNPACPNGSAGTKLGRVRYTAGANQFGGTMKSIWGGGSATSTLVTAAGPKIRNSPLGLTVVNGLPYASAMTGVGPSAKITVGGAYTANGLITQMGATTSTIPGFTNATIGFPFTTGMVQVTIPAPISSAFTGTGSDTRTPMGVGNIQMVAGSLGSSNLVGEHATLLTISLQLASPKGAPSLSRVGFATLGTLLVAVVFFAYRRR